MKITKNIGLVMVDDKLNLYIAAGSKLPTAKMGWVSTATDNQPGVKLSIAQEGTTSTDRKVICELSLFKINPAPRGCPQLRVSMCIDRGGEMTVTVRAFYDWLQPRRSRNVVSKSFTFPLDCLSA